MDNNFQILRCRDELNGSCQTLLSFLDDIFETALNTSLAVGKIRTNDLEGDAYKVIATQVEIVSKNLDLLNSRLEERLNEINIKLISLNGELNETDVSTILVNA